jgi:hypothetical protein
MSQTTPSLPVSGFANAATPTSKPKQNQHVDVSLSGVVVGSYHTIFEAEFARGLLETNGIECSFVDYHTVNMASHISMAIGGVKVVVHPDDEEHARELLSDLSEPNITPPPAISQRRQRAAVAVAIMLSVVTVLWVAIIR